MLLKLDIFNEITTVILVDVLTVFTDGNPHEPSALMDILFLVVLFGNISVHLYFLVKDTVHQTKLKCKRRGGFCCCCKPQKQKKTPIKTSLNLKEDKPTPSKAILDAKNALAVIDEEDDEEWDDKSNAPRELGRFANIPIRKQPLDAVDSEG